MEKGKGEIFGKMLRDALPAATLALTFATGAQAADQQVAEASAPLVTVTATRTDHPVEDVPSTVSVITSSDMERGLVNGIEDLVRYEPGVSAPNNPGRFGATGFTIRGVGGDRVLMQIDGIRLPDAFDFGAFSSATRNQVDLEAVKAVEILRGPASSLYGSDAIGGAVTYITKDPEDFMSLTDKPAYGSVKTGYASADESWFGTAAVAAGHGDLQAMLVYTYRNGSETDNKGSVGGTGPLRTEPNPQSYDDNNVLAKIAYRLDADNRFKLTFDHFRNETSTDVLTLNEQTPRTSSLTGEDTAQRDRISLEHEHRSDAGLPFDVLRWQVYYQQGDTRQDTHETRTGTTAGCSGVAAGANTCEFFRSFEFEQKTYGLSAQFDKLLKSGEWSQQWVYGADMFRTRTSELRDGIRTNVTTGVTTKAILPDDYPVRDFPDSDTTMLGLFVQDEIAHGAFSVIPGLRFDYYKLEPKPDDIFTADNPGVATADISEHALSPKLGLVYRLTPQYTLFGQYAYGFRAPPYNDANIGFTNLAFGYTAIANPNLKPEKSQGVEAGLRGNFSRGSFGITGFYTRYRDFIDSLHQLDCPGDPACVPGLITFQSINLSHVRIYGAEARGDAALGGGFGIFGSVAYARGDDTDLDQPVNSVDPLKLVAGLRYDAGNVWGGALTGTFVEQKRRINTAVAPVPPSSPGFGILDLTAYWNVTKQASFNAGVFNLTDRKYFLWSDLQGFGAGTSPMPTAGTIDRFSQPGRNAAITFKYQFI